MGFFTGKTVIITGGGKAAPLKDGSAGSIGYGIAIAYAKEGANLVLTGRNEQKLLDAKLELEAEYGIKVLAIPADINAGADNEATVNMVVEKTVAELEAMVDSFNISSVEAMDITGGKSAENKISELLEKQ